jgi:MarR family transcriptional regulator for hemolysin
MLFTMKYNSYESGLLFTQAHMAVRHVIYDSLEKYSLTTSHWRIMVIVNSSSDGIRLARVAEEMGVKAPLITMLANELISRDLLERLPHHTDGRAKLLTLSPQGKKLLAKINGDIDSEVSNLMEGVPDKNQESFRETLEIIKLNAKRLRLS